MNTILITGIEPFDGETINPSWEAVRALDGETIDGHVLAARQLPCVIGKGGEVLLAAIAEVDPVIVLCFGQAGGRSDISIERVAINVVDARIPDNEGCQPVDEAIVADGPAAYFSSLPIKAIVSALRQRGVPASVSQTAGTYNCNAIFYRLSHYIVTQRPALRGGFIHIPYLPEMAALHPGAPSLALETLIKAIRVIAATTLAVQSDIKIGAGALH